MAEVVIKSDTGNRPPVLTSQGDVAEREAFLSFFDEYIAQTPAQLAKSEQTRLSDYFTALHERLTRGGPVEKGGAPKHPSVISYITPPLLRDYKPRDVYKPGDLGGIFEPIAQQTRSMVLSEVMICPESAVHDTALHQKQPVGIGGLEATYLNSHPDDQRAYNFGFFVIRHQNKGAGARSDKDKYESVVGLPVLALDDGMMKAVGPYEPQNMLRSLQTVITLCNHDMMHNMVGTISKGDISRPHEARFKPELKHFMEDKTGPYHSEDELGFESALVVGHARTWQDLKDTAAGEQMTQAVTAFYDELQRVTGAMRGGSGPTLEERHRVADYFAMAVPFALARMVSLHDPLMTYALRRAQEADPAPERALSQPAHTDSMPNAPKAAQVINYYRKAGMPLAGNEDAPQSYAEAKKLQLARVLPDVTILLSPAPKGSPAYKAQARSDEMDRDIVNIIVRHSQTSPA